MAEGSRVVMRVKGENIQGDEFISTVMLRVGEGATGAEKLAGIGLATRLEGEKVFVDRVGFASVAEKANLDFDQEILSVQVENERPPKQLMFIPALILLMLVWFSQKKRIGKQENPVTA